MRTKRFVATMALVVVSGVAGGAVSGRWIQAAPAAAEVGPPRANEVSAQAIRLVDKDGKVRASLLLDEEGGPTLSLADADGRSRLQVRVDKDGSPAIELFDEAGHVRTAAGSTVIKNKRTEVVRKQPASSLMIFDKEGEIAWQAP